jgi:hypothetical protein
VYEGTPCVLWEGPMNKATGYAQVWDTERQRMVYVHRFAWEMFYGPIPGDLTVDHLCEQKLCMNPLHLDLCSRGENARRGNHLRQPAEGEWNWRDTGTCPEGHTDLLNNAGGWVCRVCRRERERLAYRTKRGLPLDGPVPAAETCSHGHVWNDDSTIYGTDGVRRCRWCRNERARKQRARKVHA